MKMFLKIMVTTLLIAASAFADKVIVLQNPVATKEDPIGSLEARVELLMNAKKTIDVQYFTIEHDYVSVAGLALLREAARRGVKVRIIVDSMHNLMTREAMGAFLNNLDPKSEQNIEIKEFNQFNIFRPHCYVRRMHDKSLIIDSQYLIVGDRNVASGYYDIPERENGESLPAYQGVDMVIAGTKSITEAKNYFEQRWNSRDVKNVRLYEYSASELDYSYCSFRGDQDTHGCEMRRESAVKRIKIEIEKLDKHFADVTGKNAKVLADRPLLKAFETAYETDDIRFIHDDANQRVCKGKNPNFNIAKTLYEIIAENTQEDLIVMTPYLVVTPEMEHLITYLVQEKNVFVRFITNSISNNDVPSATAGYLATRSRLMNIKNKAGRGVRIYEFENISNPTLRDEHGKIVKQGKALDTVHAKVVLMDSKKTYVGSSNWDYRSQNLNSEVGVVVGLTGSKLIDPTADLRNRMAGLLKTSKLVRADGTTNDETKVNVNLTAEEQVEIGAIIAARKDGVRLWTKLLSLPLVGEFLLNQL